MIDINREMQELDQGKMYKYLGIEEGSRRVWLSRTGIVMLLRSDIDGSLGGL